MQPHCLLTLDPDHEPLWVRLYVHEIGDRWAAMIVADAEKPPEPGDLKGLCFLADTAKEAELLALRRLGEDVAQR